jgi:hypothetical protein
MRTKQTSWSIQTESAPNLIIYHTDDGQAAVSLYAQDGDVWMNQNQLAELFATSVANINTHIRNILKEKELSENSVIKDYLITAADNKQYKVKFYALDMILAIGFRVRSSRRTECRQWTNTQPNILSNRQPKEMI